MTIDQTIVQSIYISKMSRRDDIPNPTKDDLNSPLFLAIWDVIKTWDIKAPEYYDGYCGGNGSHVMMILNEIRITMREEKIENILNENCNNTGSR